jgi:hypothetical protein
MVAISTTDVGTVYKLDDDDKKRYSITDDYMIGNRHYTLVGSSPTELAKEMKRCIEKTRQRLLRRAG